MSGLCCIVFSLLTLNIKEVYCDYVLYCCIVCVDVVDVLGNAGCAVTSKRAVSTKRFLFQPCLAEILSMKTLTTKSQISVALCSSTRRKYRGLDYIYVSLTLCLCIFCCNHRSSYVVQQLAATQKELELILLFSERLTYLATDLLINLSLLQLVLAFSKFAFQLSTYIRISTVLLYNNSTRIQILYE